ncbi:hypothetical protein BR93DRAFT_64061 [Coniochaeta sp. PMI_546]|nr:hypothetical protein BR93DRAFT_64061 [Coniochaeta sp. PMI_546]
MQRTCFRSQYLAKRRGWLWLVVLSLLAREYSGSCSHDDCAVMNEGTHVVHVVQFFVLCLGSCRTSSRISGTNTDHMGFSSCHWAIKMCSASASLFLLLSGCPGRLLALVQLDLSRFIVRTAARR